MNQLADLLTNELKRFGTKRALADRIKLSPSRLGRAMKGQFSLEVLNCLRLARVSGRSASEVLRAAAKGEIADLIEELYGPSRTNTITAEDRAHLDRWNRLSADERTAMTTLMEGRGRHVRKIDGSGEVRMPTTERRQIRGKKLA